MQPVQIGMNSALVLIILLLAVPLQLFLSHYINTTYPAALSKDSAGNNVESSIHTVRIEAFNRLSSGVAGMVDYVQSTFQYYSKWDNFKELFVIPYKKGHFKSTKKTLESFFKSGTIESRAKVPTAMAGGKASLSSATPKSGIKVKKSKPNANLQKQSTHSKDVKEGLKKSGSKAEELERKHLFKEVYFTRSKVPRITRPPQVKLKVGQVVMHKQDGYIGVIVGWDEVALAPREWLEKYYVDRMEIASSPHFLVLVDSRYSPSSNPYHYLPQDDLIVLESNSPVQAPEVKEYFEGFRNHRHVLRPWLQEIYPSDSN